MAKLSKRQAAIKAQLVPGKFYSIEEAVALLGSLPPAKFKESIDVAVNLGIDPRKSDQVVRGATVLPAGTGKTVRVAVFAQGANAEAAKAAGADIVGFDDLAESFSPATSTSTSSSLRRTPCAWSASSVPCSVRAVSCRTPRSAP